MHCYAFLSDAGVLESEIDIGMPASNSSGLNKIVMSTDLHITNMINIMSPYVTIPSNN